MKKKLKKKKPNLSFVNCTLTLLNISEHLSLLEYSTSSVVAGCGQRVTSLVSGSQILHTAAGRRWKLKRSSLLEGCKPPSPLTPGEPHLSDPTLGALGRKSEIKIITFRVQRTFTKGMVVQSE